MKKYWCARALDFNKENEGLEDKFEDTFYFNARNKQEARSMCAEYLTQLGCTKVELSTTSEEVWGTYDGIEVVYYGFDEE